MNRALEGKDIKESFLPEGNKHSSIQQLEHKVFGNMFDNIQYWPNKNTEKIVIADIPYDIKCLGNSAWNKSTRRFLSRFISTLQDKMKQERYGQSLVFCSFEQAQRLQAQIGGKLVFCVENRDSAESTRIMGNRVQTAVYTLWGEQRKAKAYAFPHNVVNYSFNKGEKLRNQAGNLINPGQKSTDFTSTSFNNNASKHSLR
eukprot:Nk52_evm1s939 gene=Nk52_evmTU1s939